MKVSFELTDTYDGESNYSWVKSVFYDMPDKASDLAIVRRAKKWAGWSGHRCTVDKVGGDMITIRPRGVCQVLFITFS